MSDESGQPQEGGPFNLGLAGTVVVGIIVLSFIGGLLVFGQQILNLDGESAAEQLIGAGRGTLWAPLVAILAFVLLGMTGFPQFVMIAAAVVLFGPAYGFMISWAGTMLSATLTYTLGNLFGADILRRFGGHRINSWSSTVGNRGIVATILVRIVPTGVPFVVINLAAGVSHIRLGQYLIGTGIGIIPKIALFAFIGTSLLGLLSGMNMLYFGALVLLILLWGIGGIWLRRTYLRPQNESSSEKSAE